MIRKIIKIDEVKCNGCGICVTACHEDAIGIIDGKARLLRDDYCDGLGDCLPQCPVKAITFEEREADEYNVEEVKKNMKLKKEIINTKLPCGCPGENSKVIIPENSNNVCQNTKKDVVNSQLGQWPVQIKLVPTNAAYFENANLLIAADCTAYAYGDFHMKFIKNRITLIGCPKLDSINYGEKLTQILNENNIKSITVVRMEVPCCGGIESAVKDALSASGKIIPWSVYTITTDGKIKED